MTRGRRAVLALLVLVSIGTGAVLAFLALRAESPTRVPQALRVSFLERVRTEGVIDEYRVSALSRREWLFEVDGGDVRVQTYTSPSGSGISIFYRDSAFGKAQAIFRSACSEQDGRQISAPGRSGVFEQCPAA